MNWKIKETEATKQEISNDPGNDLRQPKEYVQLILR